MMQSILLIVMKKEMQEMKVQLQQRSDLYQYKIFRLIYKTLIGKIPIFIDLPQIDFKYRRSNLILDHKAKDMNFQHRLEV